MYTTTITAPAPTIRAPDPTATSLINETIIGRCLKAAGMLIVAFQETSRIILRTW